MKNAPGIRALLLAMLFVLTRSAVSAQTLPSPWASTDLGSPKVAGSATHSSGTFTITASGSDIWGTSDQFRFVYRPVTGDVEIVARVVSITQAHRWSKAGVMIRESLTAQSAHAMMVGSAGAGYAFQRRVQTAGSSDSTAGPSNAPPGWVRLVRKGDLFSAYQSSDRVTWRLVGSDTIPMGDTVYVGLPATSHAASVTTTARIDSVTVTTTSNPTNQPPAVSVTAPAANSQYTTGASIVVNATATDPEGAMLSVDFYANQTPIGSDTTAPYSATFAATTAGNYSLTAVAHDAAGNSTTSAGVPVTVQSPANQVPTVSLTSPSAGAQFAAGATINLAANASDPENQLAKVEFFRDGTLIGTDTTAPYSFSWTNVAAGTYSLTAKAYDNAGGIGTSTAVGVTVGTSTGGLPAGQTSQDVGAPSVRGSATYSSGLYTITGGGTDIWDPSDQFQFVYTQASGDVDIRARVTSITNTNAWAKAGVMIRESLTGGSRHALALISAGNGAAFQRRPQASGPSEHTAGTLVQAPGWVRLVRTGNVFQAYESTDGAAWRLVGSQTIQMTAGVYVGLAVTSHNSGTAATARVDNLAILAPSGNTPPVVTLTSPASGATFSAPATINMTATASDPQNQLARVEFLNGTTVLATDTTAPFAWTWSNVSAGTYTVTARAYDTAGLSATSSAVTVTVGAVNAPPSVSLTAPANGASFTAPATINLTATASDPENQLTKVEFLNGGTVVGTDTTAPYSFSWGTVAAGTYSLTAKAYDGAGAVATSAAVTVTVGTVTSAPRLVVFTASADHATNVTSYFFEVFASGANPATATAIASSDLGKPTPAANNEISVDRSALFTGLAPGNYVATVTAVGPGGRTRGTAVTFTR